MSSLKKDSFRARLYDRQVSHGLELTVERPRSGSRGMQDTALEIGKAVRIFEVVDAPVAATPEPLPESLL